MTEDIKEKNQLVKAKTFILQKRASNIVNRGLSDLALLDVEGVKITDKERLLQAREWVDKAYKYPLKEADKAIESYTNAIVLDPNYVIAYELRGFAYSIKGQDDKAFEDFNRAITLDPNYADVYRTRGVVYLAKCQYDKAIEDFSRTIALDPNNSAYCFRGLAYEKEGQLERAISDFQKACDLGLQKGCENLQRILRQR